MSQKDELGNACAFKVRLHLFSIGVPNVNEAQALRDAQRIYGRHGICLEVASAQSLALPVVDQLTLNVVDGTCLWDMVSEEQDRLHSLGGDTRKVGPGEVRVYWVSQIKEAKGNTLAGCAGHAPHKPALMISAIGSRWTLAHELGHVLLTKSFVPVHSGSPNNLMFSPTANIVLDPPTLSNEQLLAMKGSPFCKPC